MKLYHDEMNALKHESDPPPHALNCSNTVFKAV